MASFSDLIKNAPRNFGVYSFINDQNKPIYIGKARNIKNRLTQYITNTNRRMQIAVSKTVEVRWLICKNEAEALLLENEHIKKHKPRYNIMLKDDKTFPEICIEKKQNFPAIRYHRGTRDEKNKYFGPFANSRHVKSVIDTLKKTTMIRGCSNADFMSRKRPCLEYQIKRCTAPCVGLVSKEEYGQQIKSAELILLGRCDEARSNLVDKMEEQSKNMHFEKAAATQSAIKALTYISNAAKAKGRHTDPLIRYLQEMHGKGGGLENVKGLGSKRKKSLLLHFGSIDEIRNASIQDIARVRGIGLATAISIFNNK